MENAGSHPPDVRCSGKGDYRHAHPERLAGGGCAAVGERVQRNIDPAIVREMRFPGWILRKQVNARAVDARAFKAVDQFMPQWLIGHRLGFQDQARGWHSAKDRTPGLEDDFGDFGEIVKRPECDAAST